MMQRILLFIFIFTASATFVFAQTSNQRPVSSEDLEYYLLQSFLVADSKQRIALNHIGIQGRFEESGFLVTAVLEGYPAHAVAMLFSLRIMSHSTRFILLIWKEMAAATLSGLLVNTN